MKRFLCFALILGFLGYNIIDSAGSTLAARQYAIQQQLGV